MLLLFYLKSMRVLFLLIVVIHIFHVIKMPIRKWHSTKIKFHYDENTLDFLLDN